MSDYTISRISPTDRRGQRQLADLLAAEGIRKDANLDYTCGMFDDDYNLIATGSCFGNTLRCMAVRSSHQGEGLMNEIVSHLTEIQYERGNMHLFLYTKCSSARFFGDLGFYEIARIPDQIVFMENRRNGFSDYLKNLEKDPVPAAGSRDSLPKRPDVSPRIAALVMNANPFTLGHQYLAERAAAENDILHLFIVSEDASLVPFAVRRHLIMDGTAHLRNIIYHDSGPYIISSATFPSYFQKDEAAVNESHAMLDLTVFVRIAHSLGINRRYVGDELKSQVTGIYNRVMSEKLPENGIECVIVPRRKCEDQPISASVARQAIKDGDWKLLTRLVPETTLRYFQSKEAEPVIDRIRMVSNVSHY